MYGGAAPRWQRLFGAVSCAPPALLSPGGLPPPGPPPNRRLWRAPEALCGGGSGVAGSPSR
eukprot:4678576-Alexandrium_andersonii.AAC.1